jgi:hypothetical protein
MSNATPTTRDQHGALRVSSGFGGAGRYAKHDRTPAEVPLAGTAWPLTPTQEQLDRAAAETDRRLRLYPSHAEEARTLTARLAYRIAIQEDCYNSFLAGLPHPEDADYESLWESDGPGLTRGRVTDMISELSGFLAEADTVGGAGSLAVERAREQVAHLQEATTCSGRNLSINQIIVTHSRVAREEDTVPF